MTITVAKLKKILDNFQDENIITPCVIVTGKQIGRAHV